MRLNSYEIVSEAVCLREDMLFLEESTMVFVQENLDAIKRLASNMKDKIDVKGGAKFLQATKGIEASARANEKAMGKKLIASIAEKTDSDPVKMESLLMQIFRGIHVGSDIISRSYALIGLSPLAWILLIIAYTKYKKRAETLGKQEGGFLKFLKDYIIGSSFYQQAKKGSLTHKFGRSLLWMILSMLTIIGIPVAVVFGVIAARYYYQGIIAHSLGYDPSRLTPEEYNQIKNDLDAGRIPAKKPNK